MTTQNIPLSAGESKTIQFSFTPTEAKQYIASVGTLTTSISATSPIIPPPVAKNLTAQIVNINDQYQVALSQGAWVGNFEIVTQIGRQDALSLTSMGDGLRFANIAIPKGSVITKAVLRLVPVADFLYYTVPSVIIGQAVDNASPFVDLADYQQRRGIVAGGPNNSNLTQGQVNWNINVWNIEVMVESPDISAIIQEIVNRPGWASGNALALFWDDHAGMNTVDWSYRVAQGIQSAPTEAPVLYIEYK